jgi:DNA repair protein RecO (recombination protein O)
MKAIAIHTIPTNDKGGVALLFTEQFGIRPYYVALGKKSTLYQAMTLLDIEERERRLGSMRMLAEVRRDPPLLDVPMHPLKASIALFMAEVLHRSLAEEQPIPALFHYCHVSMQALDLDDQVASYPIGFLCKLIDHLGFAPPPVPASDMCLDLVQGEWLGAPPLHGDFLQGEEAQRFGHAIHASHESLAELLKGRAERRILLDQLVRYLQIHLHHDRELKSYAILREVFA